MLYYKDLFGLGYEGRLRHIVWRKWHLAKKYNSHYTKMSYVKYRSKLQRFLRGKYGYLKGYSAPNPWRQIIGRKHRYKWSGYQKYQ